MEGVPNNKQTSSGSPIFSRNGSKAKHAEAFNTLMQSRDEGEEDQSLEYIRQPVVYQQKHRMQRNHALSSYKVERKSAAY